MQKLEKILEEIGVKIAGSMGEEERRAFGSGRNHPQAPIS